MPKPPKPLLQETTPSPTTQTPPPRNLIELSSSSNSNSSINLSILSYTTYMRMSCNGCRVLRKGCSENCCIRPCLQWIKTSESQSNATLFLAKFYGRAGLLNLINAGPEHLRPSIFQSMLYEACGRIVNPIYGSVGLLWSGNWKLCQSAVEAILNGDPIKDISSEITAAGAGAGVGAAANGGNPNPPFKAYDIRHVFKDEQNFQALHKVVKTRNRFKRTSGSKLVTKPKPKPDSESAEPCNLRWKRLYPEEEIIKEEKLSRESSLSRDQESMVSVEMGEGSVVNRIEMERVPENCCNGGGGDEELHLNLNLTLGF